MAERELPGAAAGAGRRSATGRGDRGRPTLDPRQRPRRLRRRRARVRRSSSTATRRRRCRGCNVIANPGFGTVVTASGSAYTWAENSRENRLTPFANDRQRPHGGGDLHPRRRRRATSGAPTPGPLPRTPTSGRSSCRHARRRHALRARRRTASRSELDVFVDAEDPVKFSLLTLTNRERPAAAAERLRLQRVGARPAAGRRAPARGDRARPGDAARSSRATPTTSDFAGARRLRRRERAAALGHRRPRSRSSAATARCARPAALGAPRALAAASARASIPAPRSRSRSSSRPGETRQRRASCSARGRTAAQARDAASRAIGSVDGRRAARARAVRAPGTTMLGAVAGAHAGRLLRPDDEPLAALPGR